LQKHRALVAFELEVMAQKLRVYGWEQGRNTAARERCVRDWIAALDCFSLPEIQAACLEHIASSPNQMPHEGHIVALIMKSRKRTAGRVIEREPEREEPRIAPERATEILREAGFTIRRML
jgi:hypothetical protein